MCGDILTNVLLFSKAFIMRSVVLCPEFLVASVHLNQSCNVTARSFVFLLLLGDMSSLPFFICVKVVILCQLPFPLNSNMVLR